MGSTVGHLLAPEVRANPYAFYAELRSRPSIPQVEPGGLWAVSRCDDVVAVLKDPQRFSSSVMGLGLPEWVGRNPFGRLVPSTDPPVHTQMRDLISRAFSAQAIAEMEPRIRELVRPLVDDVVRRRQVDFVRDFAVRLPASVICHLLGLDASLHAKFKQWTDALARITAQGLSPEEMARIRSSFEEMERYFFEVIEARRARPTGDILSTLVQAEVDGQKLSEDDLFGYCVLLLTAGLETTVHLLSNTLVVLSERPEDFQRVRAEPRLIPGLIEEVLRYEPPVHGILRRAVAETELSGTKLPANALLQVLIASASRDERFVPEADRFILERPRHPHLTFGHGIHFCLGATLARLETRLGLEALFSRVARFTRAPGPIAWDYSLSVRGPTTLPLTFEPV